MIPKKRVNSTTVSLVFAAVTLLFGGIRPAHPDALSGDCVGGEGRYDFGFAIYEGHFKNGQPDGLGALTEGDLKTVGEFKNGVPDGRCTLYYKDGHVENVRFKAGQKQQGFTQKVSAQEFERISAGVLESGREAFQNTAACEGNCKDGIGTYKFPSGNVYSGQWKNSKRDGQGTGTFANGDKYVGQWRDNAQHGQGTWTRPDGWKFVGEFRDGDPYDGTYTAPNGGTVAMSAGDVIMPPPRQPGLPGYINGYPIDMRPRPAMQRCPSCGGEGHCYSVSRHTTVTPWRAHDYGPGSVNGYNPNDAWSYHTSVSYDTVTSECIRCGGSGQIPLPSAK